MASLWPLIGLVEVVCSGESIEDVVLVGMLQAQKKAVTAFLEVHLSAISR